MLFKKTVCAIAAAAMFFNISFTTARASAEDTPPLRLLTVNAGDICDDETDMSYLGGNCFWGSSNNIYMLDDQALSEWRRTGKANFIKLSCDMELEGMFLNSLCTELGGEYLQFVKVGSDGMASDYYVFRIDKDLKKLCFAYSYSDGTLFTNKDGYSFVRGLNDGGNTVVFDPSGNMTETPFPKKGGSLSVGLLVGGDHLAYLIWNSDVTWKDGKEWYDYAVYALKRDGRLDVIYEKEQVNEFSTLSSNSDNCIIWMHNEPSQVLNQYMIYSAENGKIYPLGEIMTYRHMGEPDYFMTEPGDIADGIKDDRVVLHNRIRRYADLSGGDMINEEWYYLVKLNENAPAQIVSKRYDEIGSGNGGIYPVKFDDGRYGYIDKDGNELARFDAAGEFMGDHAAVVKDGSVYLIDRGMNIVSNGISAETFMLYQPNGEVFEFFDGSKDIIATYSDNFVGAEENSKDDPSVGAADALVPIILVSGAALIVSSKRAKKK